jgi:hypothetical protein
MHPPTDEIHNYRPPDNSRPWFRMAFLLEISEKGLIAAIVAFIKGWWS